MTTYRVTAVLSQRELIDYLDANGNVEVKIEVIPDERGQEPDMSPRGFIPRALKRKRRTRAEMEAAKASVPQAAE